MKLEKEQLEEIEFFAGLAFTPLQVESLMRFAHGTLEEADASLAYDRGLLRSEAEVWTSIFELAKAGSSPAQTLAVKRLELVKMQKL